jgi:cell wall-associated NlpC family hydrolase
LALPYTFAGVHRGVRRAAALGLVAAAGLSGQAWAASGGASAAGSRSGKQRDSSGHVYPGDSAHMGDRILREGMNGHDVRVLQDYLSLAGYRTPIVGQFGPQTKSNLMAFQRAHGMRANGILTYAVSQALRAAVAARASADPPPPPGRARLGADGLAVAPANAPAVIKRVIAAANRIAFKPYVYGGGHGSWNSSGYDCSGSVSYALHGGGLLSSPEDSGSLESYGRSGAGRWITIWTNAGHAYMYIAGLRFDTAAQGSTGGDRWTNQSRSSSGYVERHPAGY